MNFIQEQLEKILQQFNLSQEQPKITNENNFYLDLVINGVYPYQNCTISVNAYSDKGKQEIIPCDYIWSRESKNKSKIIENQKSNTYQLSFLDLGSTIKIDITPIENQYNISGTANVSIGPIKLDQNTQQILIGIMNSKGTKFPVEIDFQQNNKTLINNDQSKHKSSNQFQNYEKTFKNNNNNLQQKQINEMGFQLQNCNNNNSNIQEEYYLVLADEQIKIQSIKTPDKQLKFFYKIHEPYLQTTNDSRELVLIFDWKQEQDYQDVKEFLNVEENEFSEKITLKLRTTSRQQRDVIALAIKSRSVREYYKNSKIFDAITNYFSFNQAFSMESKDIKLDSLITFSQILEECINLQQQIGQISKNNQFLNEELYKQEEQFKTSIKSYQDLLSKSTDNTNSFQDDNEKQIQLIQQQIMIEQRQKQQKILKNHDYDEIKNHLEKQILNLQNQNDISFNSEKYSLKLQQQEQIIKNLHEQNTDLKKEIDILKQQNTQSQSSNQLYSDSEKNNQAFEILKLIEQNENLQYQVYNLKQKLFIKSQTEQNNYQNYQYAEQIDKLQNQSLQQQQKIQSLQIELEKQQINSKKEAKNTKCYSPFQNKFSKLQKEQQKLEDSDSIMKKDDSIQLKRQSKERKNTRRISQLFQDLDYQKENSSNLANQQTQRDSMGQQILNQFSCIKDPYLLQN